MTKTERNKLRKEEKQKDTVLVLIRLYDPRARRNLWTPKRVNLENVKLN